MISKRSQAIDSSGIRRVFDLAANLENPINLSIGQPDFDAFDSIKERGIEAIQSGKSGYTVTQGIPQLREEILKKYGLTDSTRGDTSVFLTSGVSGGILLSYMALLDPGDEVLIPDPFFCMYRDLALLINAEPKYYDTYPDFRIRGEEIEKAVTPKTKAIVVNSPCNPTGVAFSKEELSQVVEIARQHDIFIIYDEIYESFCYDLDHESLFGSCPKVISLSGFSKSHGIPGWRAGYALGPENVIAAMLKIQQYSFVCTPSITQWALLGEVSRDFSEQKARYQQKRDLIVDMLQEHYEFTIPSGAFYLFPKAPGGDGQAFVEKCVKNNLLVVPGSVFSRANSHFRISFSASLETIQQGAEVLRRLASE